MLNQVYPNIYQLEIPLPGNPLKAVHAYLIRGGNRNLIIDTGFNTAESRLVLSEAMTALNMTVEDTDLLVTHLHSDHAGLAAWLNSEGMKVYAGRIDGAMINAMTERSYWDRFEALNILMGMAQDAIDIEAHPGYRYCPKTPVDFIFLNEGDVLDLGTFKLKVLDTPGHTPGHICLYEADMKLLFSGDHILDRISPNISFWGFEQDILDVYLNSLDKVAALEITLCFTAHRNLLMDPHRRINELKAHHQKRLEEILTILSTGAKTVRQTAAAMHWDLRISDFEQFPPNQKWFAGGEALSHLEHLVATGRAVKRLDEGVLIYEGIR